MKMGHVWLISVVDRPAGGWQGRQPGLSGFTALQEATPVHSCVTRMADLWSCCRNQ